MIGKIMQIAKDEEGASLVEYGLLVALVAVACVVTITALGSKISSEFTKANNAMP